MKHTVPESLYLPRKGRYAVSLPALTAITVLAGLLLAGLEWYRDSHCGKILDIAFCREEAALEARAAAAEELFKRAERLLGDAKKAAGLPLPSDLRNTDSPFLGEELTPLVTTLGSLESKRLAAHPKWAYVLTCRLYRLGIRKDDTVLACFSGSFPALNLALIAACQVLQARLAAISSVTASTFGANQPGFTWPEIEVLLVNFGLIRPVSKAITLGGDNDRGDDLDAQARTLAARIQQTTASALGAKALTPIDLQQAISQRMDLYRRFSQGGHPSLFVNIGGNAAGMGQANSILQQRTGFLRPLPFDFSSQRGLIARFAERDVRVLQLLNIRELAQRWKVP